MSDTDDISQMDDPILTSEGYAELPLDDARNDAPQPQLVEAPGIQTLPNTETALGGLSSSTTPILGASSLTDESNFTRSSEVLEVQSPFSGTDTTSPSSALSTREQSETLPDSPASSISNTKDRPQQRVCHKCDKVLSGQFVHALGGTYHLECFTCIAPTSSWPSDFFTGDTGGGKTLALLSLIESLAFSTKILLRVCLIGSCESVELLKPFSEDIFAANFEKDLSFYRPRILTLVASSNHRCVECDKAVEDACFMSHSEPLPLWHMACLCCSGCRQAVACETDKLDTTPNPTTPPSLECRSCGTVRDEDVISITRLSNYAHMFWVAQARLMAVTQCDPATLLDVHPNQPDDKIEEEPADATEGAEDEYKIPEDRLGNFRGWFRRVSKRRSTSTLTTSIDIV
ncbi:Rho-type GTPase activating protein Rga1 [Elasticomyces elasticus]|nr:Rho-type GTPase activating protein Rga1 [Elasticomyces elasticus]